MPTRCSLFFSIHLRSILKGQSYKINPKYLVLLSIYIVFLFSCSKQNISEVSIHKKNKCDFIESKADDIWNQELSTQIKNNFLKLDVKHISKTADFFVKEMNDIKTSWISQQNDLCLAQQLPDKTSDQVRIARQLCLDENIAFQKSLTKEALTPDLLFARRVLGDAEELLIFLERCKDERWLDHYIEEMDSSNTEVLISISSSLYTTNFKKSSLSENEIDEHYNVLLSISKDVGSKRSACTIELDRVSWLIDIGKLEAAEQNLQKIGKDNICQKRIQKLSMVHAATTIANLKGEFDKMLSLSEELLENTNTLFQWESSSLSDKKKDFLYTDSSSDARSLIASALIALNNYARAKIEYERNLELIKDTRGINSIQAATTLDNIGTTLLYLRENDEAIKIYKEAQSIIENIRGTDHPDAARIHNNLGSAYNNNNDRIEALKEFKKALDILENALGQEGCEVAHQFSAVGLYLYHIGRNEEAIEHLENGLNIARNCRQGSRMNLGHFYYGIAVVSHSNGEREKALSNYQKARELLKNSTNNADKIKLQEIERAIANLE